jgi:hypothetical protein
MYRQLQWSTANEDLVELFGTTGQVELADILTACGPRVRRGSVCTSRGLGGGDSRPYVPLQIVSLSETVQGDAAKLQQYTACRPLVVRLNDHCHMFTPPQQPKEARQCQCKQTACELLTLYSIKALHGFTSPHPASCMS